MVRKSENIVRYTADELKAKLARGEDRTNLAEAALVPLPDGSDPDDAMEEGEWVTTKLPMPRSKAPQAH